MPASDDALRFACNCGAMHGHLSASSLKLGVHLECFCADCRAAHLYLGQPDPRPGGIKLFQTTPDKLTFIAGLEHLHLMRLSPKGLFRWYAGCCRSPLGNTLFKPTLPFFGLVTDRLDDPDRLGRIRMRAFLPGPPGKGPKHQGAFFMGTRFISRIIRARVSGAWRDTPFFDPITGKPVVKPEVLSKAERDAVTS